MLVFQIAEESRRRDRVVFVGDRKKGEIRDSKAGSIAGIKNFYNISGISDQVELVDKNWSFYEAPFVSALEQLQLTEILMQKLGGE